MSSNDILLLLDTHNKQLLINTGGDVEEQLENGENAVADPGPLMLGVLDGRTPTVDVLQTLIAQISFHIELSVP